MRHNPAPIVGPFYTDDTLPWSAQDTVNLLPVAAEDRGTRTQFMLKNAPGLKPWQKIGDGPIRALYTAESRLFMVSGATSYQVTANGIGIPLGNMPGVGRVQVAHNQVSGGNEVVFVNGSSGYLYSTRDQDYAKITDQGFPGAKSVEFIDQYFMFVEPFGRYAFTSDLADGSNYNTLDRFQAESSPDRLQCASSMQGDAVLFGQRSTQFFANTGAATGTWQSKGVVIQRGAISPSCVSKIDNSIIWVGDDGVVYRLNGYSPQRISTGPVERLLAQYNLANCFSMIWEDRGFKVYYLTVIGGPTLGYHVESGTWVRRSTWAPANDIRGRWRPAALAYFNNQWIAGDAYSGELYTMDWDYFLDRERPLVRERVTSVVSDNQNRVVADYLELMIDAQGKPSVAPDPLFPEQPELPTITGDAPNGLQGQLYSEYSYTAMGGLPPYTFKVIGKLPDGLIFSQAGKILQSTPTKAGEFGFKVVVTDSNGLPGQLNDTIYIAIDSIWAGSMSGLSGNLYSRGGVTWSDYEGAISGPYLMVWDGSKFVGVGFATNSTIAVNSVDGKNWTVLTGQPETGINALTVHDAIYLAVGVGGGCIRSTDGEMFVSQDMGSVANFYDVVWFKDKFVAVGYSARGSATGETWTELTTFIVNASTVMRGVATDGDKIVAVGDNNSIAVSSDAATWATTISPFPDGSVLSEVTYAFGKWIVASQDGDIRTSSNLAAWSNVVCAMGALPSGFSLAAGLLVAYGASGKIFTTMDGVTWEDRSVEGMTGTVYSIAGHVV